MPRAFWKGVISFGLVAIPVRMSVAAEVRGLSFHLLHKKCLNRAKQVLYCPADDEYFGQKETVRGYEYAKDQYVVLDESDFNKVALKTSHTVDIVGFVEAKTIDPIYYYGSHYLEPEELGARPFSLLRDALVRTARAGIARVVFQRREHVCCLRPLDDILVLHTLHYHSEIRPRKALAPSEPKSAQKERAMAASLIEAMATEFKPEEYRDEYQAALRQLIAAKARGEKVVTPTLPKVEVGDLMAALKASIEAARKEPVRR